MQIRLAAILQTAACLLVVGGSAGPWGVLSSVPEQAQIMSTDHWLYPALAVAAALAPQVARTAKGRRWTSVASCLTFLVLFVFVWLDDGYEKTEQLRYGPGGPRWGFAWMEWGALLGAAVAPFTTIRRDRRGFGPSSTPQAGPPS